MEDLGEDVKLFKFNKILKSFTLPFNILLIITVFIIMLIVGTNTENNKKYVTSWLLFLTRVKKMEIINKSDYSIEELLKNNVFISNHVSFVDVFVIMNNFPQLLFLADKDFLHIPVLGKNIKNCSVIVEKNTVNTLKDRLNEDKKLIIFPEGRCKNQRYLSKFKTGFFVLGKDVVPIYLEYSKDISWISKKQNIFLHMISLTLLDKNEVKIVFGNPIKYDKNTEKMMGNVYEEYLRISDRKLILEKN